MAFCSSWELLTSLENRCTNEEPKLVFKQDLVIEYNNKTTQLIPLHAHFFLPCLEMSTEEVDFGPCLVGQTRSKDIFLLNRSRSKSYWTAILVPSRSKDESAFEICPTCGILEAAALQLSTSRVALQINFTARDSKVYKTNITIQGILGERPLMFSVQGSGSIDERFQTAYTP